MTDSVQGNFARDWEVVILKQRPLILPRRHYVYPREAEEVERGALELLVEPHPGNPVLGNTEPFLATCALGFADPLAPTGVWSCPNTAQLCAVAGGYAYLIDTTAPERFEQVAYRPVLEVHAIRHAAPTNEDGLLLFVGNRSIVAYNARGRAWESDRLSDEGVAIHAWANGQLHGTGWDLGSDADRPFTLNLRSGAFMRLDSGGF